MELFDVHCHLLPHVYDGFVEWYDLESYFTLYRRCGFSGVIFTPHLYNPYVNTDVMALRGAWQRASKMAESAGLLSALASEIFVLHEDEVRGIPIFGEYALVEFPVDYAPPSFMEKLESLAPLTPLIAHIERYKWLNPDSEVVRMMKEKGYLIQVNGKALKRGGVAKEYVDKGLVDILASDCHGKVEDIIDLAEMISSHPDIMSKMSQMARHLKEVV